MKHKLKYKIAIIKHDILADRQYAKEMIKVVDFWNKRIPVNVEITEFKSTGELTFQNFEGNAKVTAGTYSREGFGIASKLIKPFEFHQVLFVFDATRQKDYARIKTEGKTVNPVALWKELYPGTRYTESSNIGWRAITHETMHAMAQLASFMGGKVVDHMDMTIVDGRTEWYYKNDDPFAVDGNYSRTLDELTNAWHLVCGEGRTRNYLEKLLAELQNRVKVLTRTK